MASLSEELTGHDFRNVNTYPDHGSPARKARETARRKMPCEVCGIVGEPVLRKPRPYSDASKEDPSAYFACPGCGLLLARLEGSAATRPSDVPEDRLPDPDDLLEQRILPAIRELAGEHGLVTHFVPDRDDGARSKLIRLTWQGRTWIDFEVRTGVRPRPGGDR